MVNKVAVRDEVRTRCVCGEQSRESGVGLLCSRYSHSVRRGVPAVANRAISAVQVPRVMVQASRERWPFRFRLLTGPFSV